LFDLNVQQLIKDFILAVLEAANIKHPCPDENPSRFNKLRIGYVLPASVGPKRRRIGRAEKEKRLSSFNNQLDAKIEHVGKPEKTQRVQTEEEWTNSPEKAEQEAIWIARSEEWERHLKYGKL
jgi:hypothetical protein